MVSPYFFGWCFLCCFEGSTWIFSHNLDLLDSLLKTWFRLTVLGWNCFKITNWDACHLRPVCPVPSWRPGHLPGAWGEGFWGERLRNLGLKAFARHPVEMLGSGFHFPSHPSGIIPSLLPVTVNTPLAFGPGPGGLALPQGVLFFCKGAHHSPFMQGPQRFSREPEIAQGTQVTETGVWTRCFLTGWLLLHSQDHFGFQTPNGAHNAGAWCKRGIHSVLIPFPSWWPSMRPSLLVMMTKGGLTLLCPAELCGAGACRKEPSRVYHVISVISLGSYYPRHRHQGYPKLPNHINLARKSLMD